MGTGHRHAPSTGEVPRGRSGEMRRLRLALLLNGAVVAVEVAGAWITGSLALLADAGHNLADVASLLVAYLACRFATLPPTPAKTYGFYRLEILSALASGVVLVAIAAGVLVEGARHLVAPPPVRGPLMLVVGAVALGGNLASLRVLEGSLGNLNVRGAWLHLASDVLSSAGVIVAALLVVALGWNLADPAASLLIGVVILASSWELLRESTDVLLQATPRELDLAAIEAEVRAMDGVRGVHDLHAWALTSDRYIATLHVEVEDADAPRRDEIVRSIAARLRDRYGIHHTTVQVEGAGFTEESRVHG